MSKVTKNRLPAADFLRGIIMILMALDHASGMVARVHFTEIWGIDFEVYPNLFWWFTRFITHLCAPGFFLLMGLSMILFYESRLARSWTVKQIRVYFIKRGFLILVLMLFVEVPAWGLSVYFNQVPADSNFGLPGFYNGGFIIPTTVLYGLGACMIIGTFLLGLREWILGLIIIFAFLISHVFVSGTSTQSDLEPYLLLTVVPGITKGLMTLYPIIPWLGVVVLGIIIGKLYLRMGSDIYKWVLRTGVVFLVFFFVIRFNGLTNFHKTDFDDWISFFTLIKYPPSLTFILFTLGVLLILFFAFRRMALSNKTRPVLIFGQTAMFFYLSHLYLYALLGAFFPNGSSSAVLYLVWILGLVLLYPLCKGYLKFKKSKPDHSIWRMI